MMHKVDEYLQFLKETRNISLNTELSYKSDLDKLMEYCISQGVESVSDVNSIMMNSYILHMEKEGKSAATISRNLASIRGFFDYLYRNRIIDQDIVSGLQAPRFEKKVPLIMSEKEVKQLLNAPKGKTPKEIRDKAMLCLLYATGIQITELISLEIDQVNVESGILMCKQPKERAISIDKRLRNLLKDYITNIRPGIVKDNNDVTELFVNMNGKPISRQGFWKIIKHYAETAGIEKTITPNMIRHSFALHQVKKGKSVDELKQILGHKDSISTQQYFQIDLEK